MSDTTQTAETTQTATLNLPNKTLKMDVVVGTENEHAFDITQLRAETGYITLDSGYGNTGACKSDITYIDGEKGILRYRGYSIEDLAEHSSFIEVAWLLIYGELPNVEQAKHLRDLLTEHEALHEGLRHHFEGFPPYGHPMAMLSSMINACSCYHPDLLEMGDSDESFMGAAAKLMSKVRTIAAFSYKKSLGQRIEYPHPELSYCRNFLHMMFSIPHAQYHPEPEVVKALSQFLILHADHEQNCSTSTVRMVGSSGANLFASCAAGVCALWGPAHGGANMAVIEMLKRLRDGDDSAAIVMEKVKKKEFRLMGFGHRVYKNFDPRAKILKKTCDELLAKLGINDPLLDIAKELEQIALEDDYFIERKLYPNVDFYSGIILRAIGLPLNMFTVLFAIGRMPGWIANWRETVNDPKGRISRPRQVYTGPAHRPYVPLEKRG